MTDKEKNKKIQDMVSDPALGIDEIIRYVKGNCQSTSLTPTTLGMLFEKYADVKYDPTDPTSCFSEEIAIEELKNIHPGFESSNGCQWARSDNSYLGKKYIIIRTKKAEKFQL
ncbi:MAG: hypothetical protein J6F31_02125 [Oscillospiraceae bacterium]|nr:hypothetical protein [Oscillospiraceae bacterium]